MDSNAPLYTIVKRPSFRLRNPDKTLSEGEYELLKLTVEDFRFITREITDDLHAVASEVRARSTILRRLLVHGDLFNAGATYRPNQALKVRPAQMLDFEPTHPGIIVSCGGYPWRSDRLAGLAMELSIQGVPPVKGPGAPWTYRENAEVPLSEYLDGLAIAVLGTRVRRREVIKYVADKKAAHVSDKRGNEAEGALDRVWSQLAITIQSSRPQQVRLSVAYLEILSVIEALAESESINAYIDELSEWLETAEMQFDGSVQSFKFDAPIDAAKKR